MAAEITRRDFTKAGLSTTLGLAAGLTEQSATSASTDTSSAEAPEQNGGEKQ